MHAVISSGTIKKIVKECLTSFLSASSKLPKAWSSKNGLANYWADTSETTRQLLKSLLCGYTVYNEIMTKNYKYPVALLSVILHASLSSCPALQRQVSQGVPGRSTTTLVALVIHGKTACLSFPKGRTEAQLQHRASAQGAPFPEVSAPQVMVKLPPSRLRPAKALWHPTGLLHLHL